MTSVSRIIVDEFLSNYLELELRVAAAMSVRDQLRTYAQAYGRQAGKTALTKRKVQAVACPFAATLGDFAKGGLTALPRMWYAG